jgi:homoserine kinase
MFLSTKQARAILRRSVEMSDFVWQTANLAGFISGCYTNDLDMIRASFEDVVIEPQRQALIPGFADVRRAAMEAGALGCSISGAGPAMFAWALEPRAEAVRVAMRREFARHQVEIDDWIAEISSPGARILGADGNAHERQA